MRSRCGRTGSPRHLADSAGRAHVPRERLGHPLCRRANRRRFGAAGRHLDGASLAALFNAERVSMSCGVPTVWLALLQHLRSSGQRLETVTRIMTGGSAAPPL